MSDVRAKWRGVRSGERSFPGEARPAVICAAAARYRFAAHLCAGKDVLDVGCGAGAGTRAIATAARLAIGLDYSAETLLANGRALRSAHVLPVAGDAVALPFCSNRFGVVTAFEVIEHLHRPETLLEEARRVLDTSGVFILSTPNRPVYSPRGTWLDYHVREYDAREFASLLGACFPSVEMHGQAHLSMDARLAMHPLNRDVYPLKRTIDPHGVIANKVRAAYVFLRWGERPGDCSEELFPVTSRDVESLPILIAVCRKEPAPRDRADGGT